MKRNFSRNYCVYGDNAVDFFNIMYGVYTENDDHDLRELELRDIHNSITIGNIQYSSKDKAIRGNLFYLEFNALIEDHYITLMDNKEEFRVTSELSEQKLIITNDENTLIVTWDKYVRSHFAAKAYYQKNDTAYGIEISQSQSVQMLIKSIIKLLSFGLYHPTYRGILSKECRELSIMEQKMLLYCAILLQIYYLPFDYIYRNDWN